MLTKKEKEIIVLKKFLTFKNIAFSEEKLNTDAAEPSDLDYDNQGYQITTASGKKIGEILKKAKKYDISDPRIMTTSTIQTNNAVDTALTPILTKKKVSADKKIILLLTNQIVDTFNNEVRELRYEEYSNYNKSLINGWKEVYCIYSPSNQLIKLSN